MRRVSARDARNRTRSFFWNLAHHRLLDLVADDARFEMGRDRVVQDAPPTVGNASLIMIAPRPRKRAMLMRDARSRLGQYARGFRDHGGGGNVAHAAMVVHGADRTMAGLARHDGFG